jgi:hypothetical protein
MPKRQTRRQQSGARKLRQAKLTSWKKLAAFNSYGKSSEIGSKIGIPGDFFKLWNVCEP